MLGSCALATVAREALKRSGTSGNGSDRGGRQRCGETYLVEAAVRVDGCPLLRREAEQTGPAGAHISVAWVPLHYRVGCGLHQYLLPAAIPHVHAL